MQDIADWVLKETNDTFYLKAVPDDAYRRLVDDTVRKMVKEWKDDGLEIKTYAESLTIMETERLVIRKITRKDTGALLASWASRKSCTHGNTALTRRRCANG